MLKFSHFVLDPQEERLWKNGTEVPLRPKPMAILSYLTRHPGHLVRHPELDRAIWGGRVHSESLLRTHVRDLRRVLGEELIETVAGRGYRFAGEVQDLAAGADALAVDAPLPAVVDDSGALELDELHDRLRGAGVLLISARADLGLLLRMNGVETPLLLVPAGTAYHESAVAQGLLRRLTARSAQPSIDRSHEDE